MIEFLRAIVKDGHYVRIIVFVIVIEGIKENTQSIPAVGRPENITVIIALCRCVPKSLRNVKLAKCKKLQAPLLYSPIRRHRCDHVPKHGTQSQLPTNRNWSMISSKWHPFDCATTEQHEHFLNWQLHLGIKKKNAWKYRDQYRIKIIAERAKIIVVGQFTIPPTCHYRNHFAISFGLITR